MHRLKLRSNMESKEPLFGSEGGQSNKEKLAKITSVINRFETYVTKVVKKEVDKMLHFFTKSLYDFVDHPPTKALSVQDLDIFEEKLETLYAGFTMKFSDTIKFFLEKQYLEIIGGNQGKSEGNAKIRFSDLMQESFSARESENEKSVYDEVASFRKKVDTREHEVISTLEDEAESLDDEDFTESDLEFISETESSQDGRLDVSMVETDGDLTVPRWKGKKGVQVREEEDRNEAIDLRSESILSVYQKPSIETESKFSQKFVKSSKMCSQFYDAEAENFMVEHKIEDMYGPISHLNPKQGSFFTKGDRELNKLLNSMDTFLVALQTEIEEISIEKGIRGNAVELCTTQRSERWFKARSCRLTSSNFGRVFNRKSFTCMEKFVGSFFTRMNSDKIPALKYGIETEDLAFSRYQKTLKNGCKATETGFWVNKRYPWLGGSPDGFKLYPNGYRRSMEIKCPYNGRDLDIESLYEERSKKSGFFLIEDENLKFVLNPKHNYMAQIQGVMEIAETTECDFIVYTSKDFYCTTEKKNLQYIKELFEKLKMVYFRFLLPNLCRRADYNSPMPQYRQISQELYEKKYQ